MGLRRAPLLATVAAFAAASGASVAQTEALGRWERDILAARFDVRGARPSPLPVAVVGVDERTLQRVR